MISVTIEIETQRHFSCVNCNSLLNSYVLRLDGMTVYLLILSSLNNTMLSRSGTVIGINKWLASISCLQSFRKHVYPQKALLT